MKKFLEYLSFIMAVLAFICGLVALVVVLNSGPRLVGYGCYGTGGPIYAYEEDAFPACDNIERRNSSDI